MTSYVDKLHSATECLATGKGVILRDDFSEAPRSFLLMPAAHITESQINLMITKARGVILAPVGEAKLRSLGLTPMTARVPNSNADFFVSVEARSGVTTGISAIDRSITLQSLARSIDARQDLVTPGHIFPLRAKEGGVLVRSGIAEAAVDLLILCDQVPVGALCQCLNSQGGILDTAETTSLARELAVPDICISDIIRWRLSRETIVEQIAQARLPTSYAGELRAHCFLSKTDGSEHLALVKGEINQSDEHGLQIPILTRVHAEDPLGDLLAYEGRSGLAGLRGALSKIAEANRGVLIYIRHSRLGYFGEQVAEQIAGDSKERHPSPARELREHGIGAQILNALGAKRITLLSNSNKDIAGLGAFNLEITGREPFKPCL